jgi:hypothetical protein
VGLGCKRKISYDFLLFHPLDIVFSLNLVKGTSVGTNFFFLIEFEDANRHMTFLWTKLERTLTRQKKSL